MLTYHPAFDPYHATFRVLQLLMAEACGQAEIERVYISDFLLLFPQANEDMKLPRPLALWRKKLSTYTNQYFLNSPIRNVFRQMQPMQNMALSLLFSRGIIAADAFAQGIVTLVPKALNQSLADAVSRRNLREATVITFIHDLNNGLPLLGPDGLKARSGLMEFRYDSSL